MVVLLMIDILCQDLHKVLSVEGIARVYCTGFQKGNSVRNAKAGLLKAP